MHQFHIRIVRFIWSSFFQVEITQELIFYGFTHNVKVHFSKIFTATIFVFITKWGISSPDSYREVDCSAGREGHPSSWNKNKIGD